MIPFVLHSAGCNFEPNIEGAQRLDWPKAAPIEATVVPDGVAPGRASIALRFTLPDTGQVVVAEVTALQFVSAARAIAALFPSQFGG